MKWCNAIRGQSRFRTACGSTRLRCRGNTGTRQHGIMAFQRLSRPLREPLGFLPLSHQQKGNSNSSVCQYLRNIGERFHTTRLSNLPLVLLPRIANIATCKGMFDRGVSFAHDFPFRPSTALGNKTSHRQQRMVCPIGKLTVWQTATVATSKKDPKGGQGIGLSKSD